MTKYAVAGGEVGSTSVWKVVELNDAGTVESVLCHLHGPASAFVAFAAVERMNSREWTWEGLGTRLNNVIYREPQEDI